MIPAQNDVEPASSPDCRWWQIHCKGPVVEGLPADAPRKGTVVTVDTRQNVAYLFKDGELITKGPAATGSEKTLQKGSKVWMFHTPRGTMRVLRKIVDPIWTKPDWAFVEDGKPIPPPDSPKRQMKGHLGKYALDLGDGIMIHGTDNPDSLGKNVSHGCIRLGADMLETVYKEENVGTTVYVY